VNDFTKKNQNKGNRIEFIILLRA